MPRRLRAAVSFYRDRGQLSRPRQVPANLAAGDWSKVIGPVGGATGMLPGIVRPERRVGLAGTVGQSPKLEHQEIILGHGDLKDVVLVRPHLRSVVAHQCSCERSLPDGAVADLEGIWINILKRPQGVRICSTPNEQPHRVDLDPRLAEVSDINPESCETGLWPGSLVSSKIRRNLQALLKAWGLQALETGVRPDGASDDCYDLEDRSRAT